MLQEIEAETGGTEDEFKLTLRKIKRAKFIHRITNGQEIIPIFDKF